MKKMKTVFVIDRENGNVAINEVMPGNEWVIAGEGVATRKVDGTSVLIRDGVMFKRFDAKHGKNPPVGFIPCEERPDEHTGHWPGWVPVGEGPEDKFHREAFAKRNDWEDGTFELVGPKINGNREKIDSHELWRHGAIVLADVPRTFDGLREWLEANVMEGIVFHHPDGRMAKIRRKDFRFRW